MANPNRLFIKVHNGFPEHPKTAELSDKAFRHLIELWCFCSRNLNDGVLTETQLSKQLSRKVRQELVSAGFIDETSEGPRMHDYLDHQQSAQQVADLRERRAEAGSKGGRAKASRVASAKGGAKQTPSKSVADTDTDKDPDDSPSGESGVGTAVALADPTNRRDVEDICDHLAGAIEANGSKRPVVTTKWRTAARLMLDKDGRTQEEIHGAIEWCQRDEFWRANVLSLPTLREKYDQLRLQAQRKGRPSKQQETDDLFARNAARMGVSGGIL